MKVSKGLFFLAIAAVLSGGVIAEAPSAALTPVKLPAKSIASLAAQKAAHAEAARKTAEAIAAAAPVITGDLMDKMVPEGAQLVDGTQQGEFFIVPEGAAMPKIETAKTIR